MAIKQKLLYFSHKCVTCYSWNMISQPIGTATAGVAGLLDLLRSRGPLTRAELVTATGLSRSTVAARVEVLQDIGLVGPAGAATSNGGRPPARLAWCPGARTVVAIDLGASHAHVAVTDLAGTVEAFETVVIDVADGPEPVLDSLAATAHRLRDGLPEPRRTPLAGVGIGLPGPVSAATGRPVAPPIMPGWDDYDVRGRLAAAFGAAVVVDNDVNIMALGEHEAAWPDVRDLLFVKVATGIGAGIIAGGMLQRGAAGSAGDLGHVRVPDGEEVPCACGGVGCLEAVASGRAIARDLLGDGAAIDMVVRQARDGDAVALQRLRRAGRDLGAVLAGAVNLLNPKVIVLGGRLAACGEPLVAGVREEVYRISTVAATADLRIVLSTTGPDTALRGAARSVADHALSAAALDGASSWSSATA